MLDFQSSECLVFDKWIHLDTWMIRQNIYNDIQVLAFLFIQNNSEHYLETCDS